MLDCDLLFICSFPSANANFRCGAAYQMTLLVISSFFMEGVVGTISTQCSRLVLANFTFLQA